MRRHGIFSARPEYPDLALRGNPEHRILAFGNGVPTNVWSRWLRPLKKWHADSQCSIGYRRHRPSENARIPAIHPRETGFPLRRDFYGICCRRRYSAVVPELQRRRASLYLFGGIKRNRASGLHVWSADCGFRHSRFSGDWQTKKVWRLTSSRREKPRNWRSIWSTCLQNRERQIEMAMQNVSAALRMSMPEIIRQYLRTFELRRNSSRCARFLPCGKFHAGCPCAISLVRRNARKTLLRSNRKRVERRSAAAAGNGSEFTKWCTWPLAASSRTQTSSDWHRLAFRDKTKSREKTEFAVPFAKLLKDRPLLKLVRSRHQPVVHPLHQTIFLREIILFLIATIGIIGIAVVTIAGHQHLQAAGQTLRLN